MERLEQFIKYAKLYLISVEQDASKLTKLLDEYKGDLDSDEYRGLEVDDVLNTGEMHATQHLLSVAQGMLNGDEDWREGV